MRDDGPNKVRGIPSITLMEGPRQNGKEYDFEGPEELLAKIREQLELHGYDSTQITSFMVYASTGNRSPDGVPLDVYAAAQEDDDSDGVVSLSWNIWSVKELEEQLRNPDDEETPFSDIRWQVGSAMLVIAQPEHFLGAPRVTRAPSPEYAASDIVLLVDLPDPKS